MTKQLLTKMKCSGKRLEILKSSAHYIDTLNEFRVTLKQLWQLEVDVITARNKKLVKKEFDTELDWYNQHIQDKKQLLDLNIPLSIR